MANLTLYNYDLDFRWKLTNEVAESSGWGIFNASNYMNSYFLRPSWNIRPSSFPIFGEYRQPLAAKNGVDDTGYVYQAFLPFLDSEQRRKISNFKGPAFVVDSRVSCQKPNVSDLRITVDNDTQRIELKSSWYHGTINGTVSNLTAIDDLWFPRDPDLEPNIKTNISFSCQQIIAKSVIVNWMNSSYHICQIQGESRPLFHVKQNENLEVYIGSETAGSLRSGLFNFSIRDPTPSHSPAYLIISSNWTMPNYDYEAFKRVTVPVSFPAGVEKASTLPYLPSSIDIQLSLCYTSWGSSNTHVELNTPEN